MRALTVQQPWAWAIVHGGKDVENRTQAWSYRGPLAIHAGKRLSERGFAVEPMVQAFMATGLGRDETVDPFPLGAIIGIVDLVDVHVCSALHFTGEIMCCESVWAESSYVEHGGRERQAIAHLMLERPRPLAEPVPCRGALGLWTVPPGVDDQVRLQLPLDVTGVLD